jgi:hypothetical protein
MTTTPDELIERGLRAWTAGDLDALEIVLDPAVVSSMRPVDFDGPQPFPVATRITVAGGRVTAMQQYRTDDPSAATT